MQINVLIHHFFTTSNGLAHNEFNLTSHYQLEYEWLFLEDLGGLIFFNPNKVQEDVRYQIPLQFASIKVFDEKVGTIQDCMDQLIDADEIVLTPSMKMLELEFALLDFEETQLHQYACQIKGYDEHWFGFGDRVDRIARWSNLV